MIQSVSNLRFSQQSGFTLLELMAVVFIIGIILSFANLSIGQQGDKRLESESKRLYHLLRLASDEAILQAREYGILFTDKDYEFLALDREGKFSPIKDDVMFRKRVLDEDFRLALEMEGELVEFDPKQTSPKVFIFSSGEMSEFKVIFSIPDDDFADYAVRTSFSGEVTLLEPGQKEIDDAGWTF